MKINKFAENDTGLCDVDFFALFGEDSSKLKLNSSKVCKAGKIFLEIRNKLTFINNMKTYYEYLDTIFQNDMGLKKLNELSAKYEELSAMAKTDPNLDILKEENEYELKYGKKKTIPFSVTFAISHMYEDGTVDHVKTIKAIEKNWPIGLDEKKLEQLELISTKFL